jgi:hypothetical protein
MWVDLGFVIEYNIFPKENFHVGSFLNRSSGSQVAANVHVIIASSDIMS